MGTYIYAVLKGKKIMVGNETIHLCKFQFKPYSFHSDNSPIWYARLERIKNSWGDEKLPRLICVGDEFKDGQEVFDQFQKYDYSRKCSIPAKITFYDDYDGFGKLVGWLKKNGRKWSIVKENTEKINGSVNGVSGIFEKHMSVIDGKCNEEYKKIGELPSLSS